MNFWEYKVLSIQKMERKCPLNYDMLLTSDYSMFVKTYNEGREHGGSGGQIPSEMFLMKEGLNHLSINKKVTQIKASGIHICR